MNNPNIEKSRCPTCGRWHYPWCFDPLIEDRPEEEEVGRDLAADIVDEEPDF
jgi:hypothetical protein